MPTGPQKKLTELKQTEEELRKSEASLADAQRIAHVGNWDWDIAKNKILWSDEIYRIMGLTPQEFGASYETFLNYVHLDDKEFVKRSVNEAVSDGKPYNIHHRIVQADGQVRTVHELGEVYRDTDGIAIRMVGTVQDITELKQTEEELRKSEASLADAQRIAHVGNWDWDIANGILSWSDEIYRIFRITPQEFSPTYEAYMKFVHPDDRELVNKTMEKAVSDAKPYSLYHRIVLGDGQERTIHALAEVNCNTDGKAIRIVGTVQDITDARQAEEALKKEHELLIKTNADLKKAYEQEGALREQLVNAERLASLGKMASKIAHEINNPLTVIMGQSELQLSKTKDPLMISALKKISEKSKEVAELTRRYMDLGKPHEIKMSSILISEVLGRTVNSLKSLGILKNVKILETYTEKEPHILGDAGMLEQVFRNLLINAIHASEDAISGEITVGTNIKKNRKAVTAYISDKGIGIQNEDIDKIFEHYYTTKEDGTGTGLGLPISKEITEVIHGGELSLESEPGKGTIFNVTIPIDKYAMKKKRILIVDDEAYITDTFGEYLSSKGFLIRKAQNGKEALKIYSEFEPELILSDFNMPEMDGIELFTEFRKIKPDQLFVMITGAFLTPVELKLLSDNNIPQIIKPAELENELLKTVKEQLEKTS